MTDKNDPNDEWGLNFLVFDSKLRVLGGSNEWNGNLSDIFEDTSDIKKCYGKMKISDQERVIIKTKDEYLRCDLIRISKTKWIVLARQRETIRRDLLHDIRNKAHSTIVFIELGLFDDMKDETRENLQTALESSKGMMKLLEKL